MIRPKGLGRGLDALLAGDDAAPAEGEALRMLAVDRIRVGVMDGEVRTIDFK